MTGKLYAIGVGPGDPQSLTMKAISVINEADVIACPAKDVYSIPDTAGYFSMLIVKCKERNAMDDI